MIISLITIIADAIMLYYLFGINAVVIYLVLFPIISFAIDLTRFCILHPRNEKRIMLSEFMNLKSVLNILTNKGINMNRYRVYVTLQDIDDIQYLGLWTIIIPRKMLDTYTLGTLSSLICQAVGHVKKCHSFSRNLLCINLVILTLAISSVWCILVVTIIIIAGNIAKKKRSKALVLIVSLFSGIFCYFNIRKLIHFVPAYFKNAYKILTHMLNCDADTFVAASGLGKYYIEYLRNNEFSDVIYDRIQKLERLI